MYDVQITDAFEDWMVGLRDVRARQKINARIKRIEAGNLGDAKFFDWIGELRIHDGPGYRIYFAMRGRVLVILLCGGDKSTQGSDIQRALAMSKEL